MQNDTAYANADFIPDGAGFPDRWAEEARAHREREAAVGRARLNAPYGEHPRERLDIFHPAGRAEGLVVFIHGGYWLRFDRTDWSHLSAGPTARGWAVAMPSYPLAPEARIGDIARSVAAAVAEAARLIPGPVVLTGHSAGGHLVARVSLSDSALPTAVRARLRRVVPISPVADLRPLLETSMNRDLRLDPAEARAESPALVPPPAVPVSVWVGAEERPAFLAQARGLASAWDAALHIAPGRHHFDIVDLLADPEGPMVADLLAVPA